ncbi:MAG TPA: fumarylacetoacetate hydrolase family protein [Candidatus Thermoplasmatota archaeon]|nr:fumarylacetoacetate hydrolase family protein [Candidatus Thermoplasmatota archaeon]
MDLAVRGGGRLRAGKVIGVVGNYAGHRAEMHAPATPELGFFLKATSALLPDGGTIVLPPGVGRVEHEVELAVVIGTRCQRVRPEHALEHVFGYAVVLDVTARDLQAQAKKLGQPWDEAKGFDTFAPVSAIARRFEVEDPHDLDISLRINGQLRQQGNTKQMLHQVPDVIARLSRSMTLEHGDVIATGTPEGVGPLAAGDVVEAEIARVGKLRCKVAQG